MAGFFTPKRILALILALIALLFVFSNTETMTLSFVGIDIALPGWLWFIALLAIGFVVGSITPWFRSKKKQ
ncbi:hypothetical protein [Glutamicibacter sp.]|uniref:hypothetical protein n=1 Tax=Glutamicibacter sp. TaxID=1931995 RepID=UPI0028BE60E2|nr:hypothetical protein [Glutamicibacter sp.]